MDIKGKRGRKARTYSFRHFNAEMRESTYEVLIELARKMKKPRREIVEAAVLAYAGQVPIDELDALSKIEQIKKILN